MPDAPRDRPAAATVLREFSGFVSSDDDDVFESLAKRFTPNQSAVSRPLVDSVERLIVVQGNWWYRGEWRVSRDPAGSLVEYTILNIAELAHWAGRLTARRVLKDAPRGFDELVESIRTELE
jgi:hypothetical protein